MAGWAEFYKVFPTSFIRFSTFQCPLEPPWCSSFNSTRIFSWVGTTWELTHVCISKGSLKPIMYAGVCDAVPTPEWIVHTRQWSALSRTI